MDTTSTENGAQAPQDAPSADVQMPDVAAAQDPPQSQETASAPAIAEPVPKTEPVAEPATAAPEPAPEPATAAPEQPVPTKTAGTPLRGEAQGSGGGGTASRAQSVHPDHATPGPAMPAKAADHGAPVRQYLNSRVTGPLLEGMKIVAKEQPADPLRVLGEYLLQRSKELEGTGS